MRGHRFGKFFPLAMLLLGPHLLSAQFQQPSDFRDRALEMLDNISKDMQKHYYDPKFHGVDWPATVRETKEKIKTSDSFNLAMAHVAQALISLNDSHTFFLPPPRPYIHSYGFEMQMIGGRCYIVRVRPGSDAQAKGLNPGDELLTFEGYRPDRDNLWKLDYRYNILQPQASVQLGIRDGHGQARQVEVMAKFRKLTVAPAGSLDRFRYAEYEEYLQHPRWAEAGEEVGIWKLPSFVFDEPQVEGMLAKARKRSTLILDLRGNPGGAVDSLKFLLGGMFDKDVKIADVVGRKESKPEVAKARRHGVFSGKLVVLIDSGSASAAELFARIVQLEKRGVVLGDLSSGSVMEAKTFDYEQGIGAVTLYGAEITAANLLMSDGKSLEHVGVTPDELVLPTAADLEAGRDPVLSRAAALLGANLNPGEAGRLFPYEWPPE